MRRDALQRLKAGLAGTATTKLLDVLEAAFGVAEAEDEVPDIQPTPTEADKVLPSSTFVPKAAETLDQPSTSGLKCKAKKDISGASKRKSVKPSKSGPVALADATPFYPTAKQKANYLHIGVDPQYISQRKGSQFTKLVVNQCFYARRCRERGEHPEECDVLTQNKAQMSTHIRKFHLGICVACYICPEQWWSSLEWKKHMKDKHSNFPEESWYIQDTADIGADIAIKTEVAPEDI